MISPQLIKHRVCFAFFAFGLCLAVIHGACSGSNLEHGFHLTMISDLEIIVSRHL